MNTENVSMQMPLFPISVAPTDGTHVDLWLDGKRYPDCWIDPNPTHKSGKPVWLMYNSTCAGSSTMLHFELTWSDDELSRMYWSPIPQLHMDSEPLGALEKALIAAMHAQELSARQLLKLTDARLDWSTNQSNVAAATHLYEMTQEYVKTLNQVADSYMEFAQNIKDTLANANQTEEA